MLFVSYFYKTSPRGAFLPASIIIKDRNSVNNIYDYNMLVDYIEAHHSRVYVPINVTIITWKTIGGEATTA